MTAATYLRRGLMWLLIGIALTVAMFARHDNGAWWCLILVAVGLAYLLFYRIAARDKQPPGYDPAQRKPS